MAAQARRLTFGTTFGDGMDRLKALLARLHEQSVWQVLVSYAVGSWIILQITETLSSLIGLPLWMGQGVVFVLLLGLPVLLLVALVKSWPVEGVGDRARLSRFLTWRTAFLVGGAAFTALGFWTTGYVGMRAAGIGPAGTLISTGVLASSDRLLLADFENTTADPTLTVLVSEVLRVDLQQSPAVTLIEPAGVAAALQRMLLDHETVLTEERAREVAVREGIKAVLAGTIASAGNRIVLAARLVSPRDGAILAAHRETAEVGDVIEALDRLSAQMRERIGESLRSIQGDAPLESVTTASLQALEKYAQAQRANDLGDGQRAIRLLEEAVAEDSLFAMAYRKLAIILNNNSVSPERAQESFARAYELRNRLTERERYHAEASYHAYVRNDISASNAVYESLLERYATDPIALNNLAVNLRGQGRNEEAEALFRRSVQQGGAPAVTYESAVEVQFGLGMYEVAEATLRAFREAYPNHPSVPRIRMALASARFDFVAAEDRAVDWERAATSDPASQFRLSLERANLALVRGRPSEATPLYLEGLVYAEEAGLRFLTIPRALFVGMTQAWTDLLFVDDPAGALARMDRVLAAVGYEGVEPEARDDLQLAALYARSGQPGRARAFVSAYEARLPELGGGPASRPGELWATYGGISLAEGRAEDAVAELLQARSAIPGCALCWLEDLGEAYARAGQTSESVDAYREYLDSPVLYRLGTDTFSLPLALDGLAQVYETQGDTVRAIETYERLSDLWSEADSVLRPRLERLRATIARLRAGGAG